MASAASASPGTLFDTPSNGTRSARRKPDGPARSPGAPLVIPVGRGSSVTQQTAATERPGLSSQRQQQQGEVQPPPEVQQQQQQRQSRLRQQAPPTAADEDVIVIDSDDDDAAAADDEVVITGVTVGQKRPRQQLPPQQRQAGFVQQQRQQQVPQQHIPRRGVPTMPTWEQPAAPVQPPSPEPAFKCLICLEGIKSDNMATTPCGHMFCFDCINDAVRVTKKCPKCRKNVTLKAIKRLYPN